MAKRRVVYIEILYPKPPRIGERVQLIPLNHYSTDYVQNGHEAMTTPVESINADGTIFETKNTQYVPLGTGEEFAVLRKTEEQA